MWLALEVPKISGPFFEPTFRPELQGAHHPRLVADADKRWWVKKNLPARGILAEAVGALLGHLLGVPIPKFGIFDDEKNGKGWLSSYVTQAVHWHQKRLQNLENFGDLGKMLVLDAIIYNEDRNPENIILEPGDDPESFSFWAIDMEAALVSRPRELASKGTRCPDPFALPPGFNAAALDHSIARTVTQAKGFSDETLRALVRASVNAAGARDENTLFEALRLRCRGAAEIVEDYLRRLAERAAHNAR